MSIDARHILQQMMDENNTDPVEIVNSRGETARFSQIGLIASSEDSDLYKSDGKEHSFAILQPLDEGGNEVGRSIVVDICTDEYGECTLSVVDDRRLISAVYAVYNEERGITPEDVPDDDGPGSEGDDAAEDGEPGDDPEDGEEEDGPEEKPKKGFFSRLFGRKDG